MVTSPYIPARGDIVYLTFDPVRGHEQKGRRPALVLSSRRYNELIGLAAVCPITSKTKGYQFEIPITVRDRQAVILCDHVRSLAWKERNVNFVDSIDRLVFEEVVKKIALLIAG